MASYSRRRFLTLSVLAGGASVLAACGAAAAPTPAKPTAVPEVAKPFATVAPTTAAVAPAATKPADKPAAAAPATTKPAAAAPAPAKAAGVGADTPLLTARPPAGKPPVTVRLHFRTGGDKSEPAIYVERPGEWAKETGHKVELEPIPPGREYPPKVISLAAGNQLGDVMFTSVSEANHYFFVKNKLLEPMDDYLPKYNINRNEWVKAIVDSLTTEGKFYGMPKASNPAEAHFSINLKLFEEAGLKKPDTYGTTREQLRDWAVKLTKGPPDRREVYGYYLHYRSNQAVTNQVRALGGDLIDKAGEKSLVDSPQFADWLAFTYKLIREDKVHPMPDVVPPGNSNELAGLFAAGKIAMTQMHRAWMVAFRTAVGDKFPWTTIQYPRAQGAKGWVANIDTHALTTQSKNKDEAFTLSYALADRRFAYVVAKGQGYLTGRNDNLEAMGPDLAKDEFLKLQQRCTEEEEPWWIAKNLRQLEVEAELVNQLDNVWLGKRAPDRAFIADLKKGLDDVLAKPPA